MKQNTKMALYKVRLNEEDKTILHAFDAVVEGIAEVFGTNCEVVVHSLEDPSRSIVKIVNGHVTGREVGSPLTDFAVKMLNKADRLESDMIGTYYSKLDDGRLLKCVTVLIRNTEGQPIGLMCVNIDLSVPFLDFLGGFLPSRDEPSQNVVEHFPLNVKDLIDRMLETVMSDVNSQRGVSPSEKNKMIVLELYKGGIFNVRGAIDVVAKQIGVSRYTIYNYIREARVRAEGEL